MRASLLLLCLGICLAGSGCPAPAPIKPTPANPSSNPAQGYVDDLNKAKAAAATINSHQAILEQGQKQLLEGHGQ